MSDELLALRHNKALEIIQRSDNLKSEPFRLYITLELVL